MGLSLEATRGWLSTLCAYLPHVAPRVLDPALVRHWHDALRDVDVLTAEELALRLTADPGRWITFPTRQQFAELRRELVGVALGQATGIRAEMVAARAALKGHDRRSAA